MTDTDLAAAVRAAVDQWMKATTPAEQQAQLSTPEMLGRTLAGAAAATLVLAGQTAAGVREFFLAAPFRLLRGAFDPTVLPDTPQAFFPVPDSPGTVAGRATALAVHALLQLETVSYGAENEGNLFVNLVTMPGQGKVPEKSKKNMRGHTDGVSFPLNGEDDAGNPRIAPSPDLVTLIGLRNPGQVPTRLMPLKDILALMTPKDIAELKRPQYAISSQTTFVLGMKKILGKELVAFDVPVLTDCAAGTYVRFSHTKVVAQEEGGRRAAGFRQFRSGVQSSCPAGHRPARRPADHQQPPGHPWARRGRRRSRRQFAVGSPLLRPGH